MTTTTFRNLEVSDYLDTDKELEFTVEYNTTWLTVEDIEKLISHLQNVLNEK